jgi:2-polyprenyl-3-methyl-5-hydroxy-6-metoxy-1,4-benzoquinol methylase
MTNTTVTAQDYDIRVKDVPVEQLIREYYDPPQGPRKRRIGIVLEAACPRKDERILDLGCGVGEFAYHCSISGARCLGVDYSFESIRMARRICRSYGADVSFLVADAGKLPLAEGIFDTVIAADFIEHLTDEDKERVLDQIQRLLKSGGMAVVFTPNGIREKIGEWYHGIRHALFGERMPSTDLHFGLIDRFSFERMARRHGFKLSMRYFDLTRPWLARVPLLKHLLALNLLWVMRRDSDV